MFQEGWRFAAPARAAWAENSEKLDHSMRIRPEPLQMPFHLEQGVMEWNGVPFHHAAELPTDLVTQVLDRVPDLAAALAEALFDLARRPFRASLVCESIVVHHVADFFFDAALHLIGLAADFISVPH